MSVAGPRLALWGRFDEPRLADLLTPRLLEQELLARLPGAVIQTFAPFGAERPLPLDGGLPATPLGRPGPARTATFADAWDLIMVAGDLPRRADGDSPAAYLLDGLGEEGERSCPVIWLAVGLPVAPPAGARLEALSRRPFLSVRDTGTLDLLRAAGVDRPVEVTGDPLLLAARHADPEVLERRRRYLAHMGWWPAEPPVVVQGDVDWLGRADELAAALAATKKPVVLLATDPAEEGEGIFLDALSSRLPEARRPESPSQNEMLAVLAGAGAVVASSRGAGNVARSFQVPVVLALDDLASRLAAALATRGPSVDAELARLDGVLDTVALLARESAERRNPGAGTAGLASVREEALRNAFSEQERRFSAERLLLAERIERLSDGWSAEDVRRGLAAHDELIRLRQELAETEAKRLQIERWLESNVEASRQKSVQLDEKEDERKRLVGELEAMRAEFARLNGTRLFRYTAPLRAVYARLRRR